MKEDPELHICNKCLPPEQVVMITAVPNHKKKLTRHTRCFATHIVAETNRRPASKDLSITALSPGTARLLPLASTVRVRTKRATGVGAAGAVGAELAAARRTLEQGTLIALREFVVRALAGFAAGAAAGGWCLHLALLEPWGVPGDGIGLGRQALSEGKAGEAEDEKSADGGGETHGVGGV